MRFVLVASIPQSDALSLLIRSATFDVYSPCVVATKMRWRTVWPIPLHFLSPLFGAAAP
ncbi:hypothetical protein Syun_012597 [Stephania yunnanensis]|uniref:Uncharacterized protein n=1 Tax=Stephania yunnanensis TaxID=152371 RepID=A0AAP0PGJ0_9MAGN